MYSHRSVMSNTSSDNQSLDLSGLDFGPVWARKGASGEQPAKLVGKETSDRTLNLAEHSYRLPKVLLQASCRLKKV